MRKSFNSPWRFITPRVSCCSGASCAISGIYTYHGRKAYDRQRRVRGQDCNYLELIARIAQPFRWDIAGNNEREVVVEPFDGRVQCVGVRIFE